MTLHGALKARTASPTARGADLPDEPTAASASRAPEMAKQLRGLLEGLGIDPNALEVRIGVRKLGEPGRLYGGEATNPSAADQQAAGGLDLALLSRGEVRRFRRGKRTADD